MISVSALGLHLMPEAATIAIIKKPPLHNDVLIDYKVD